MLRTNSLTTLGDGRLCMQWPHAIVGAEPVADATGQLYHNSTSLVLSNYNHSPIHLDTIVALCSVMLGNQKCRTTSCSVTAASELRPPEIELRRRQYASFKFYSVISLFAGPMCPVLDPAMVTTVNFFHGNEFYTARRAKLAWLLLARH